MRGLFFFHGVSSVYSRSDSLFEGIRSSFSLKLLGMALERSSPSILMVERSVFMKLRKEKRVRLLTQIGLEDTDVASQLGGSGAGSYQRSAS